jgi:hypothetical protein
MLCCAQGLVRSLSGARRCGALGMHRLQVCGNPPADQGGDRPGRARLDMAPARVNGLSSPEAGPEDQRVMPDIVDTSKRRYYICMRPCRVRRTDGARIWTSLRPQWPDAWVSEDGLCEAPHCTSLVSGTRTTITFDISTTTTEVGQHIQTKEVASVHQAPAGV